MWFVVALSSLMVAGIAGDNIAVVPFLTRMGTTIYGTIFWAYCIGGAVIAGLSAWIGMRTGRELPYVSRKVFGARGKSFLAVLILAVCLPASSLTGGIIAGQALACLTGLNMPLAALIFLLVTTFLAVRDAAEVLHVGNFVAVSLLPVVLWMFWQIPSGSISWDGIGLWNTDWRMVWALVGYNAGGMRPALWVEAAMYLKKKKIGVIFLIIGAKIAEGIFTLLIAALVLTAGTAGPLALSQNAGLLWGKTGQMMLLAVMLCTFASTMVPAMMVNARQLMTLFSIPYQWALLIALLLVWSGTLVSVDGLLGVIGGAGLGTVVFVTVTALFLHKNTA